ncbi:MAG: hypothetical protein HKN86_01450 [Acidimicrobiia bacterium]|nr:hypothetical protein [Acidimicrobiia bacterium]
MKTKKEIIDKIEEVKRNNENSSYLKFYSKTEKYIYSFFKSKKRSFDKETFYQGFLMIYGWMPTIPYQNKKFSEITKTELSLLLKVYDHAGDNGITKSELEQIIPFVNNSIVGLSKMLHFINKDRYAIWDSRIAKVFGLNYNYQVNNIDQYLIYNEAMLYCIDYDLNLRNLEKKLFIYSFTKNNQ